MTSPAGRGQSRRLTQAQQLGMVAALQRNHRLSSLSVASFLPPLLLVDISVHLGRLSLPVGDTDVDSLPVARVLGGDIFLHDHGAS